MAIDYEAAGLLLARTFAEIEHEVLQQRKPEIPDHLKDDFETVFASGTQAYREALAGCTLARILDPRTNIRLPYMNQGSGAYNGRTLDERVVNPFLHDNRIDPELSRAVPGRLSAIRQLYRRNSRWPKRQDWFRRFS